MKEVILTASVLILAMILFRFLFRSTIPRRVQYALWALVLVRLLVPVQVPDLPIVSVLEVGQQAGQQLTAALERPVALAPVRVQTAEMTAQPVTEQAPDNAQTQVFETRPSAGETGAALPASTVSPARVLDVVWKAGMAAVAAFFLLANLRFRLRLKKSRVPFPAEGCPLPVYLCDRLSSPCLVGLARPAVYLTPAAVRSDRLDYVLLHERTHARHLDPLWALLRCVCLTVYWFHPLVWAAALLSRADCELACDEGAMAALDHGGRLDYGRTLLALVPVSGRPANPLLAATTMASGRRQLRDRITRIAHQKRPVLAAVLAAVVLAGLAAACTFSGSNTAVYEDGVFTLSSSQLTPYTAPAFQPDPNAQQLSSRRCSDYGMVLYQAKDGSTYPAVSYNTSGEAMPWAETGSPTLSVLSTRHELQNTCQLFYYVGLLGTDGLITSYPGVDPIQPWNWVYDFFAVDGEGGLSLLLRTYGTTGDRIEVHDLNGDGVYELFTDRQLFFQAGGALYAVDYAGLLAEHWPAFRSLEEAELAAGDSCVLLTGTMEGENGQTASFLRTLTLEGDVLTVTRPDTGNEGTMAFSLSDLEVYQEGNDPAPAPVENNLSSRHRGVDYSAELYADGSGGYYPALIVTTGSSYAFDSVNTSGGAASGQRQMLRDFSALLGYQGLLVGWTDGADWVIDLYRWNETEGLVRFLRGECSRYGNARIVDLDGDGDCELVTDRQLFFRRDGTIYTVTYEDFFKAHWPAFRCLDTAAADSLEGCVVLSGTCVDEGGQTVSFFRRLYLEESGLILAG